MHGCWAPGVCGRCRDAFSGRRESLRARTGRGLMVGHTSTCWIRPMRALKLTQLRNQVAMELAGIAELEVGEALVWCFAHGAHGRNISEVLITCQ